MLNVMARANKITYANEVPSSEGYIMPGEWENHEATWLSWPHNPTDWPSKIDTIRWVYSEIVRKISASEIVRILVDSRAEEGRARKYLIRAGVDVERVEFFVQPTDRGWNRDSGPIFVRRKIGRKTSTAIVDFHFNAWAKYPDWRKDRRIAQFAARKLGKPLFNAQSNGREFVLEGGGIDVNGRGTLLTTEECYLDKRTQIRNPGLSRGDFEGALKEYLGARKIFWLGKGISGDDTHGHIDDLCRFVNPTTIVLIREKQRRDVNWRALAENWERIQDLRLEDGSKPEVIDLPMPEPLFFDNYRLPASYANFYITNAAVIVPTFNDTNDRSALGILGELFKDRSVVGIHAVDLVLGFGTLHCLSQQQPA